MPKIAAIEFDEKKARVLVAKTTGSSLQLGSAFEVDFESSFEDSASEFGKELAKVLGNKTGRCDALISFGRGLSELRMIKVPVVPDNELPEIVRFQSIRQFTNCTEDSPVDFLSLSETGEETRVLAATVPKSTIDNLKTGCLSAGLNVKGVKLRATCTTALSQSIATDRKNYIILSPSDKTFNLDVVAYGKLCLTRTVRSTSGEQGPQIVSEIRRTLAAAKNQIQDYEAKSVVIFGEEKNFEGLRAAIENDVQFEVDFVNPFDHVKGPRTQPEKPGNYGSLIGLLVDHCSKTTETIDFLNPRKKSLDLGNNRIKLLTAIAAAILFIGLGGLGYLLLAQKSSKIKGIKNQIAQMSKNDKIAKEIIGDIGKIEKFENKQAVWLRELANLSNNFLDPDQVILNTATFALDPGNENEGIRIESSGFLQSGDISEKIGNMVRADETYDATLENVVLLSAKEKDQDIYSHKFKARVYRAPELRIPDIAEKELVDYMEPRKELGKKELEEPVKEEPVKEEPVKEEPVNEEPVKEEPDKEEPDKEEPDKEEPDDEEPDKEEPDDEEPDDEEPAKEEPDDKETPKGKGSKSDADADENRKDRENDSKQSDAENGDRDRNDDDKELSNE